MFFKMSINASVTSITVMQIPVVVIPQGRLHGLATNDTLDRRHLEIVTISMNAALLPITPIQMLLVPIPLEVFDASVRMGMQGWDI